MKRRNENTTYVYVYVLYVYVWCGIMIIAKQANIFCRIIGAGHKAAHKSHFKGLKTPRKLTVNTLFEIKSSIWYGKRWIVFNFKSLSNTSENLASHVYPTSPPPHSRLRGACEACEAKRREITAHALFESVARCIHSNLEDDFLFYNSRWRGVACVIQILDEFVSVCTISFRLFPFWF